MYVCMHTLMNEGPIGYWFVKGWIVCMNECLYVCMYVCMHECMYVCMCVCMYVCINIYCIPDWLQLGKVWDRYLAAW